MHDMWRKGRGVYSGQLAHGPGEDTPAAKLKNEQVLSIRNRAADGEAHRNLAKEFGVELSTIGAIVMRRSWKHLGGPTGKYRKRVLNAEQVLEIRRRAATGESQTALSREFGVGHAAINSIVHRRSWRKI
jgi:transposase